MWGRFQRLPALGGAEEALRNITSFARICGRLLDVTPATWKTAISNHCHTAIGISIIPRKRRKVPQIEHKFEYDTSVL